MTRLLARQNAVSLQELSAEDTKHVTGGEILVPSIPGIGIEILPGLWVEPQPLPGPNPGIVTFGINEN